MSRGVGHWTGGRGWLTRLWRSNKTAYTLLRWAPHAPVCACVHACRHRSRTSHARSRPEPRQGLTGKGDAVEDLPAHRQPEGHAGAHKGGDVVADPLQAQGPGAGRQGGRGAGRQAGRQAGRRAESQGRARTTTRHGRQVIKNVRKSSRLVCLPVRLPGQLSTSLRACVHRGLHPCTARRSRCVPPAAAEAPPITVVRKHWSNIGIGCTWVREWPHLVGVVNGPYAAAAPVRCARRPLHAPRAGVAVHLDVVERPAGGARSSPKRHTCA